MSEMVDAKMGFESFLGLALLDLNPCNKSNYLSKSAN